MSNSKKVATETNKRIGKKIKALRKEAGLSQEEFGKKYHLSQNDVTNIENGYKTVSYDVLLDIAKDYDGVTTDYIIKENGVRGNNPDLQYICDYTGLNERAINELNYSKNQNSVYKGLLCRFINYLLSTTNFIFIFRVFDIKDIFNSAKETIKKIDSINDYETFESIFSSLKDDENKINGVRFTINEDITRTFDDFIAKEFDCNSYLDVRCVFSENVSRLFDIENRLIEEKEEGENNE